MTTLIRKFDHLEVVNARQKAEGGSFCYFATPKYCLTLDDLLAHAEDNHERCKSAKMGARNRLMGASKLMKHASDLRIHSQAILRRAGEMPCHDYNLYKKVKAQAERTYKLKT